MAKQTINIGSAPNDGTGDLIRVAMDKINNNFTEVYTSYVMSGALTVGDATTNSVVSNTGGFYTGNSTANVTLNSTSLKIGNTTANHVANALGVYTTGLVNATSFRVGTSTVANSSGVYTTGAINAASINVSSNTFNLGNSSASSNGYTYLPNGFKMVWGKVAANSSVGNATFASAFTTNAYSVIATSVNTTITAAVTSINSTVAVIRTANDTAVDVYWTAIGK